MPQSLANILIHAIWSTKDRRPFISDDVRAGLHGYMAGILKNLESSALIINSVADHVHILCQLSKNLAACKLVEEVKKSSSKWMKEQGVLGFTWQNGYGLFSVRLCGHILKVKPNITRGMISKMNFVNFAKNTMWQLMSVMCGIDLYRPFRAQIVFGHYSQGVALGCHVLRFQRVIRWKNQKN